MPENIIRNIGETIPTKIMGNSNVTQGTTFLMVSQFIFVASGYALHIFLGRQLGPANYGTFVVVLSLMTVVNLILTTGIPQAASKFISENENEARSVEYTVTRLQFIFGFMVFAVYLMSAGQIAQLLNDPSLEDYIRISAFVIPSYAMYSVFTGFLNGRRRFRDQSYATIYYSLAKLSFITILVFLGFSVYGAVAGFVLAPVVGLMVGIYWTGFESKGINYDLKKIINFAIPVILFSVAVNLIGSIDIFFVKALLPDADQASGFYSAASQVAKVPSYLVGALLSALFPAISSDMHLGNFTRVRMYVSESLRNLIMFLMPVVLIISATSGKIITLLYSSSYIQAGEPLGVLVIGIGMFSVFMLFVTIITGSGHPGVAMLLSFIVLGLDYALNMFLVPNYALMGAAAATTLASLFGLILTSAYILKMFGVLMEPVSFIKIVLASLIVYIIALEIPIRGLLLPLWYIVMFGIYLSILALTKEFNRNDFRTLMHILTGRT